MQAQNVLSSFSDMLPEGSKDKTPEFVDFFNQYLNQSISGSDVNGKLEKIFDEAPVAPKNEEILNDIIKTDNLQNKPSNQRITNYSFANVRKRSRQWTPEEDKRLIDAINSKGNDNWSQIAKMVGNGRSHSQCSQRWHRVLDPKISKLNWSKEEEEKLINLVGTFGTKAWTKISSKMGNRSDVQCRFRYKFLLKKADDNAEQIAPIGLPQALITKNSQLDESISLYEQDDA